MGTLRVQKEADGAEKLGFNASYTHYTNVMNADGLVAFGDTICQYKGNKIKMTTKGLLNVAVLQAATASEPAQQVSVVLSPFRYEQVGQQRSTNQLVVGYNDFVDAYNNSRERSTMKVAMYSDLLYDAHKQN